MNTYLSLIVKFHHWFDEYGAQTWRMIIFLNPLVPELFGRAQKNLIFYRGIEHYRFIFLTRCWLGKPHSNHISLNRQRVWDSPHFLIEKIE